ncbi:MAG: hypothetical protein HQM06_13420 [Magnetococcales bacterium]|nr:hypothetical protein [Magnetococcales bacterium]
MENNLDENYPTDEELERISEALYSSLCSREVEEGIDIDEIGIIDACNHVISGTIDSRGSVFAFVVEFGNASGTVVRKWGKPEDVKTHDIVERNEPYTLLPIDTSLHLTRPLMFHVYLEWRKQSWFEEFVKGYNYDTFFSPGNVTRNYWCNKAKEKGLRFAKLSEEKKSLQDAMALSYEDLLQRHNNAPPPSFLNALADALTEEMMGNDGK